MMKSDIIVIISYSIEKDSTAFSSSNRFFPWAKLYRDANLSDFLNYLKLIKIT